MKMVGGGEIKEYPPSDEGPHLPGKGELWQESVVLVWWDLKQSIGGRIRVGHEPNRDGGKSVIWTSVFAPEGIF